MLLLNTEFKTRLTVTVSHLMTPSETSSSHANNRHPGVLSSCGLEGKFGTACLSAWQTAGSGLIPGRSTVRAIFLTAGSSLDKPKWVKLDTFVCFLDQFTIKMCARVFYNRIMFLYLGMAEAESLYAFSRSIFVQKNMCQKISGNWRKSRTFLFI